MKKLAEVVAEKPNKIKIQANLDKDIVKCAENKLKCYGLSRTTALNMFYHAIASSDTFPITPKLSKRDKALQDLDDAFANANIPTRQFKNEKEAMEYLRDDKNW